MSLRRLLREPLLHFLLLGLALFLYFGRVAPDPADQTHIVVGQPQVDLLVAQFQGTWNRPPSPAELRGLVDAFIRDEILYRQGVALGLDRDDAVIKRRVRQKMDVLFEESVAQNPATDSDLQAYLAANPDQFRLQPVVSFEQVYLGADDAGVATRVTSARVALTRGTDPASLGQATLLPARQEALPLDFVARDFGQEFATQLSQAPVGEWSGPIKSGFGVHLVRVGTFVPARLPEFADVRDTVAREWENARRERAHAAAFAELRRQYVVEIKAALPPTPAP